MANEFLRNTKSRNMHTTNIHVNVTYLSFSITGTSVQRLIMPSPSELT